MSGESWWYLSRASGIISWAFLTMSVMWGILLSTDLFARFRKKPWLLDLHRGLGALTVVFTGVHIGALVADSYVHFGWAEVLIPFASGWKPGPVALGVISMWIIGLVEASSLFMKRLPKRLWRSVHQLSYVAFVLGSLHGTFAGTDAANPIYAISSVAVSVVLIFAVAYRVLTRRGPRNRETNVEAPPLDTVRS